MDFVKHAEEELANKKKAAGQDPVDAPGSRVVSLRFSRLDYAKLELRAAKVDLSVPAYVREELFRKR